MNGDGGKESYKPVSEGDEGEPINEDEYAQASARLGIPREHWSHPTVREFVGFLNQVQRIQERMSAGQVADAGWIFREPGRAHAQPGGLESDSLQPDVGTRYWLAENLLRAVIAILQDGFPGYEAHPDYLAGKINAAVNRYGLRVVKEPGAGMPGQI